MTAGTELGEYRLGYISQDDTRHQVSLADAQAVRFEVMIPARRFAARKGQRQFVGAGPKKLTEPIPGSEQGLVLCGVPAVQRGVLVSGPRDFGWVVA